jgi:hypothetical protein
VAQTSTSKSRTDIAMGAAQDAVRASIEAAQKVADCSMEAGSEAAQQVQTSLKEALQALRPDGGAKKPAGQTSTSRKSA